MKGKEDLGFPVKSPIIQFRIIKMIIRIHLLYTPQDNCYDSLLILFLTPIFTSMT